MSAFSNRFFGIFRRPLPDSDVTVDMGKGLCQRLRYSEVMHCPYCQNSDTKVIDTRISDDGFSIRRRRVCQICHKRFTTVESTMLLVRKRSGNVEPFDRKKVVSGVRKACQGRPINEDDLRTLGQRVEEDLRARGLPKSIRTMSARRYWLLYGSSMRSPTCDSPACIRISMVLRTSSEP